MDPALPLFLDTHFSGLGHGDPPDWRVPYMP
jgi:hypothetical protein